MLACYPSTELNLAGATFTPHYFRWRWGRRWRLRAYWPTSPRSTAIASSPTGLSVFCDLCRSLSFFDLRFWSRILKFSVRLQNPLVLCFVIDPPENKTKRNDALLPPANSSTIMPLSATLLCDDPRYLSFLVRVSLLSHSSATMVAVFFLGHSSRCLHAYYVATLRDGCLFSTGARARPVSGGARAVHVPCPPSGPRAYPGPPDRRRRPSVRGVGQWMILPTCIDCIHLDIMLLPCDSCSDDLTFFARFVIGLYSSLHCRWWCWSSLICIRPCPACVLDHGVWCLQSNKSPPAKILLWIFTRHFSWLTLPIWLKCS